MRRPTGIIDSPSYPGNYAGPRTCEWVVILPVGRQIFLNVTDFSLETSQDCANDYLEIRYSLYTSSPVSTIERPVLDGDAGCRYAITVATCDYTRALRRRLKQCCDLSVCLSVCPSVCPIR